MRNFVYGQGDIVRKGGDYGLLSPEESRMHFSGFFKADRQKSYYLFYRPQILRKYITIFYDKTGKGEERSLCPNRVFSIHQKKLEG